MGESRVTRHRIDEHKLLMVRARLEVAREKVERLEKMEVEILAVLDHDPASQSPTVFKFASEAEIEEAFHRLSQNIAKGMSDDAPFIQQAILELSQEALTGWQPLKGGLNANRKATN